ncbi:MAG: putative sugar nucleotidyl transferase [Flavobacteriaceae bacterium]|jgi:UDP-N-acetylglucosamine diphosphorylase/glucosamine-1-phosphate N-acetyltransferase|nr:putative sugar nucleotidyl transferase [Flavobacteriaceae bacterium]
MRICLFDGPDRSDLLPLVYTRPVADLLIGGMSLAKRWSQALQAEVVVETEAYLQIETPSFDLAIMAGCLPNPALLSAVKKLRDGQKLMHDGKLIAFNGARSSTDKLLAAFEAVELAVEIQIIRYPWDLFSKNTEILIEDAAFYSETHTNKLNETNQHHGEYPLLVGTNVTSFAATYNTQDGPIIIDDDATVMEGAVLRGPIYIGKSSIIKMGAKIYGGTSLGSHCKVGGELNNVVILGNSNKGHDGFLGNAVIGEWCNIGAATDASNLKNDYGSTRAWNYTQQKFISTELQFCGLIMGDHSKTAIQTPLNTATVVGVGCSIFSTGFPRTFIPSFSRGGSQGMTENNLNKMLETAAVVMDRRGKALDAKDKAVLTHLFALTKQFR